MNKKFTTVIGFLKAAQEMAGAFDSWTEENELIQHVVSDHICYKCGDSDSFEDIRRLFEGESCFIYQSIISKRRIAYIKFKTPILTVAGPIAFIELSDQKPDGSQKEGFDHIEIVPKALAFPELIGMAHKKRIPINKIERPHHTTYDVTVGQYSIKFSKEPLAAKIKREEM